MNCEHDLQLRRHAVQLVAQLPENPEDCDRVLAYMREVMDNFIRGGWYTQQHQDAVVLPLRPTSAS